MAGVRILVVGSANVDLVFAAERLPRVGETLTAASFETLPGGKGANQAVAAAKLGAEVSFVGCVGSDSYGEQLRESLPTAGVDLSFLTVTDRAPTGVAGIFVDSNGGNSILVAQGANALLTPEIVRSAIDRLDPEFTLCQLEIPFDAVQAAGSAKNFILNPAPARELPAELLARCFVLTPNETETEALTGIAPVDFDTCERAGNQLLDKGVKNVVITLGERGSYWVSESRSRHFAAPEVTAIDTTAAGDIFNGALVSALVRSLELDEAIIFANKAAALSTTRRGAQPSAPTLHEIAAQEALAP